VGFRCSSDSTDLWPEQDRQAVALLSSERWRLFYDFAYVLSKARCLEFSPQVISSCMVIGSVPRTGGKLPTETVLFRRHCETSGSPGRSIAQQKARSLGARLTAGCLLPQKICVPTGGGVDSRSEVFRASRALVFLCLPRGGHQGLPHGTS
jgi:hypothetical protein